MKNYFRSVKDIRLFSVSVLGSHRASEHRGLRPCVHSMGSLKPGVTQTKLASVALLSCPSLYTCSSLALASFTPGCSVWCSLRCHQCSQRISCSWYIHPISKCPALCPFPSALCSLLRNWETHLHSAACSWKCGLSQRHLSHKNYCECPQKISC